jgi:NAD(P)-dependent dehydrogenase (short-subunit alcohol dehydrogenase family)
MSRPDFGLEGKSVLVVGGGQGMGESTARILAAAGAGVAVLDAERERAERVAADLAGLGARSLAVTADVLDDASLVDAVGRTERELGDLHGLVTIVGAATWSPIVDMSLDHWDLDHRRNLRYFFVAAREVARSMLRRHAGGSIVCVASVDGIQSAALHASYGAAKAGLMNLVKTMSAEWAPNGIRINAIAPGAMVTPRIPLRDEAEEAAMMSSVPMRRRGTTDDIGRAALFFLSDLSTYVTGQTLAVDGGFESTGVGLPTLRKGRKPVGHR